MCYECYSSNSDNTVTTYATEHPAKTLVIAGLTIAVSVALYDYFATGSNKTVEDIDRQRTHTAGTLAEKAGHFIYVMTWPISKWTLNICSKNDACKCGKCNCEE